MSVMCFHQCKTSKTLFKLTYRTLLLQSRVSLLWWSHEVTPVQPSSQALSPLSQRQGGRAWDRGWLSLLVSTSHARCLRKWNFFLLTSNPVQDNGIRISTNAEGNRPTFFFSSPWNHSSLTRSSKTMTSPVWKKLKTQVQIRWSLR